MHRGAWSSWVRGISHEPHDGWFVRLDDNFKALPTKVGGVYEIGIGSESELEPERVVYCGRALATEAGGGTSLRARLYSGYAKSGSHLHVRMRLELDKGHDVFFRWKILLVKEDIAQTEADMIATGKYVWNKISAPKTKSIATLLDEMIGDDEEKIKAVAKWLKGKGITI